MCAAVQEALPEQNDTHETTGSLQLVSFRLAEEEYGIEITKIREIILAGEITRVPQTPHYVKGLINLRGTVIPVIDLRARFGLPEAELTVDSRIMVLSVGSTMIGIVVDAVSEVLRVTQDQIAPPPATIASHGEDSFTGLVKLDERLLMLLDIDTILGEQDAIALSSAVDGTG